MTYEQIKIERLEEKIASLEKINKEMEKQMELQNGFVTAAYESLLCSQEVLAAWKDAGRATITLAEASIMVNCAIRKLGWEA